MLAKGLGECLYMICRQAVIPTMQLVQVMLRQESIRSIWAALYVVGSGEDVWVRIKGAPIGKDARQVGLRVFKKN